MYLSYYNLRELPFNITPDPRFLYFSTKHQEAFNHLLFGIHERKGFIELTGEVGAGKTTICRKLLEELGPNYKTALVLNPCLTIDQLLQAIVMEFDLKVYGLDRVYYLQALNQFVLEQARQNNDVVLFIDEAQDLSDELLEQVRLLSNLETDHQKLMQIVLMGQPELRDKLAQPELRQLRQRITVRYHLGPLDLSETGFYINHRLTLAGANGSPRFDEGATKLIYKYSGGVPRLINAVCDKSLLAGFVTQTDLLNKKVIKLAIDELDGVLV
ncbi:MAG TPA: AAA family ATPase [Verrucomicrobiae bacterium]|nr:AAA family ATPase [Verrucomicrobiae bacterium]